MPTQSIQFPASQPAVQTAVHAEAQPAAAQNAPGAVLGGPGVSVSVSGSALDKLVAKVKGESEDARLDAAKRRIAIVLTVLSAMNLQFTETQRNNLVQLETLNALLDELAELLSDKEGDLGAAEAAQAVMEAKIDGLRKAVENAVKDGEEHRKQVEELKRTRKADDAELRAAEDALAKSEAALAAARTNLDGALSSLEEAKNNVESLKTDIASLKNQISGVRTKIADCAAAVGDKALAAVANALRADETHAAQEHGPHETEADREQEEAKKIANDPLRAIREALDRMDADILRTIEDNRTMLV